MHEEEGVKAYPLTWPAGWDRTRFPENGRFGDHSIYEASKGINHELALLGARKIVLSSNLKLNNDGTPRSSQKNPADQAVVIYFELKGNPQCIPCDRWRNIEHNLHAIRLSIGAMRGLSRWGADRFVNAAFSGFKAIPEKTGVDWRAILELDSNSNILDAERNYKELARIHHPDMQGGSEAKMGELNLAMKEARNYYS